jgi:hypothetical protein
MHPPGDGGVGKAELPYKEANAVSSSDLDTAKHGVVLLSEGPKYFGYIFRVFYAKCDILKSPIPKNVSMSSTRFFFVAKFDP